MKIPCFTTVFALLLIPILRAQEPLTQSQACDRFSKAVIRIEAGGRSRGTGFLVSEDGFILTAAHVIKDADTGQYFSTIAVSLPDGSTPTAIPVPMTLDSAGGDFAILKIEGKSNLPFLPLGIVEEAKLGSDATIIGYPFSALTGEGKNISIRFCLAALVAASDLATVPVTGTNRVGQKNIPVNKDVKVDVIYFQGPSVKGISGSPLISRSTGHVIGIVSIKLTGIGASLNDLKNQTAHGVGTGIIISGLNPGAAVNQILTVLDDQLANDLGAATGISDPAYALKKAKRDYERQHPKK